MLDSLRQSASSWLVKILLGALIVSFAIWGVADIFHGYNRQKLAEIGGREISVPEFENAYQTQLNIFSNQLGRQLTSTEARAIGLPQSVLESLVGSTAVSIHADKLALGIEQQTVIDLITSDPSFAGPGGKFDRKNFEEILRSNGLGEARFVAMQRNDLIRNQIAGTLTSGIYAPKVLVDAVNHYQNDQRMLKYFIVPVAVAGTVDAPDENTLKTFYEEHKNAFKAPEFRKIGILMLSPDTVKDTIKVPEEEVKASYEANKKKYAVLEQRTIQQLVFKNKAAAEEARQKLAKGADFMKLGQELGMKETDINMGTFTQEKMADHKIAEVAFRLEKNKPSEVVDGFFPIIVRVTEIKPGSQKTFEEVKGKVRDELAKARATELLSKLYDQVEDGRGGGSSLADIGKKLNIKFEELTFDSRGQGLDGKKIESIEKLPEVIKQAFTGEIGVENNPLTLADSFAFVELREVIPARLKPLTEIQEDVKKVWIEEETRKRIEKMTTGLMTRAAAGEKIEVLAGAASAQVTQTPLLKRTEVQPGLPITAVAQAFSLPDKAFGSALTPDRKSRVIFQVIEIKPAPAPDEKQAEALRKQIRAGMGNDILAQYVNGLRNAYGVQINTKAMSDIIGQ